MRCALLFFIFYFLVCTTFCQSKPSSSKESNAVPTTPLVLKYFTVERKYRAFINFPPPSETVVPTRDLINENVKRVQPLGVVLRRCPETLLGTEHDNWPCHSTGSVNVTLQVRVEKDFGFKFYDITTTEDTSCACGTKESDFMGQ